MLNWYMHVLSNYANFGGRARRAEYWNYVLVNFIVLVLLYFVSSILHPLFFLYGLYALVTLIPSIAVGIRRLHDTNRSGWWWLIAFVPFIGAIVLIVFAVQEGTPGPNQYGQDPRGAVAGAPA